MSPIANMSESREDFVVGNKKLTEELERVRRSREAIEARIKLREIARQEREAGIIASEQPERDVTAALRQELQEYEREVREVQELQEYEREMREVQEYRRLVQDQTLREYLTQISSVTATNVDRLILRPRKPEETGTKSYMSEQPDITGIYYPLRLRPWQAFSELHRDAWARVEAAIGQQRLFPSINSVVNTSRADIEEQLPREFLRSELFLNEPKTSHFVHVTLQTPASRILNAYLAAVGHTKIYFDNQTAGLLAQSFLGDEDSQDPKIPVKTRPNCVVLRTNVDAKNAKRDEEDEGDEDDPSADPVSRFTIGEHITTHHLRAAAVACILEGPMPEDCTVQLAKRCRPESQDTDDEGSAPTTTIPGDAPDQDLFAHALAQAYHFLLVSGLEFGYLATGEMLILLHIPADDCTTLLYHTALLPESSSGNPSSTAMIDPLTADEATFRQLSISRLCSLCLLALESSNNPRSIRWRTAAITKAPKFPELKPDDGVTSSFSPPVPDQSAPSSFQSPGASSLGKRGRRDDDDDDDDGGGARGAARSRLEVQNQPRVPSPLQHSETPTTDTGAGDNEASETCENLKTTHTPQTLSKPSENLAPQQKSHYCTQACLLGLMQGQELDHNCPNVLLHKQSSASNMHPVTRSQLPELVRLQLLRDPEQDCECFVDRCCSGIIGCPFKITLTGYGYTFIAKGVQSNNHHRLVRESRIYQKLASLQGRLIPVHLGLVELAVPYPMVNFALVTHMMLLSFAGLPFYSARLERRAHRLGWTVDWGEEAERTMRELRAAGLFVDEEEVGDDTINMLWCQETQRAMRIDFGFADVVPVPASSC